MTTAKLIDLVMNFVIDPYLVILCTIVLQCFKHIILVKAVNNLMAEIRMKTSSKKFAKI